MDTWLLPQSVYHCILSYLKRIHSFDPDSDLRVHTGFGDWLKVRNFDRDSELGSGFGVWIRIRSLDPDSMI